MNHCLAADGIIPDSTAAHATTPYSPAGHRALIVERVAANARPINMVDYDPYKREVDMLHPGTTVPSPSTVSHDLNDVYLQMSIHIRNYLMVSRYFSA